MTSYPCNKRPYRKRGAVTAAARRNRYYGLQTYNAYFCRECGVWHIGHKPGNVRAGNIKARLENRGQK